MKLLIILSIIFLINQSLVLSTHIPQCRIPGDNDRLDCHPQDGATQVGCLSRGCCWSPPNRLRGEFGSSPISVPFCYYPTDFSNYQIKSLVQNNQGVKATLTKLRQTYLPKEIMTLSLEVIFETNSRVRVRITDPNQARYEVPITLSDKDKIPPANPEYDVIIPENGPFSMEVKRKSDSVSIFKSYGPLLYSDQFIQISSLMSTNQGYGIGEQNRPLLHKLSNGWSRIGLWARDNPVDVDFNLYGTHPFYMAMPSDGKAFGIYFFNSNAQEFVLQPTPALTYRTTGGVLDMFLFTGGTPAKTTAQYLELIGKPMLPPYWSLGFHLSRYGYKNLADIEQTLQRNLDANISIEVQWTDIDYMDKYKDFTVDNQNYGNLGSYVKNVREKSGVKFVAILDPAISTEGGKSYSTYEEGAEMDVYIKDSRNNQPLIGKVWPGDTVYPDFTHPNALSYWTKQIKRFQEKVPVDGLWIDMNEPANFYDGSKSGCPANNPYDYPFFVPNIRDASLISKTICSSALHFNNVPHYNLHNIYGYKEALTTNAALQQIRPNKRPFILSRSTFSGSGKYTFHWTGDNFASWEQMEHSIRQVLNFNIFGIPMTGADICGFINDSNEELCIRWMQLGAFYPFMRNHNSIDAKNQDPAVWSKSAQATMKHAICTRYMLLPHFYTTLVKSHLNGETVMRPLSFEFYSDPVTHSIDLQFLIGSSILVNPVVKPGVDTLTAYFPAGIWYDFYDSHVISSSDKGAWIDLYAPLDTINIALRGGSIVATSMPQKNTEESRKGGFILYCGMSEDITATGELYWDDGESLDSYTSNKYSHIKFNASSNGFDITPDVTSYESMPPILSIVVVGLKKPSISTVTANNIPIPFSFQPGESLLLLENINLSLDKTIRINWS